METYAFISLERTKPRTGKVLKAWRQQQAIKKSHAEKRQSQILPRKTILVAIQRMDCWGQEWRRETSQEAFAEVCSRNWRRVGLRERGGLGGILRRIWQDAVWVEVAGRKRTEARGLPGCWLGWLVDEQWSHPLGVASSRRRKWTGA